MAKIAVSTVSCRFNYLLHPMCTCFLCRFFQFAEVFFRAFSRVRFVFTSLIPTVFGSRVSSLSDLSNFRCTRLSSFSPICLIFLLRLSPHRVLTCSLLSSTVGCFLRPHALIPPDLCMYVGLISLQHLGKTDAFWRSSLFSSFFRTSRLRGSDSCSDA